MRFEIGELYSRADDIHVVFGGSRQSGIAPSADHPLIFLFSGSGGERFGYQDDWSQGVFLYTGEGQVGEMVFTRGNKAIQDHTVDGRDLHLFRSLGKGQLQRYEGQFICSGWHNGHGPDRNGNRRQTIVFHLLNANDLGVDRPRTDTSNHTELDPDNLEGLRQRALASAGPAPNEPSSQGRHNIYQRSEAVRAYVLARAAAKCESCGKEAPFRRTDGSAYLEPHHIRRLSDGGPDHPRWVAAICPNCHRQIHFGVHGRRLNDALADTIGKLET